MVSLNGSDLENLVITSLTLDVGFFFVFFYFYFFLFIYFFKLIWLAYYMFLLCLT